MHENTGKFIKNYFKFYHECWIGRREKISFKKFAFEKIENQPEKLDVFFSIEFFKLNANQRKTRISILKDLFL